MKKLVLALAASWLALAASAQPAGSVALEPALQPLDPALLELAKQAPSAFELRELSPQQTEELLSSLEGPAWRIRAVSGPACENPKSKHKADRQVCRQLKAQCRAAEQFATSYGHHAACSALYTQTSVLLSNDGKGHDAQRATALREKALVQAKHKSKPKATTVKRSKGARKAKPAIKQPENANRC